MPEASTFDLEQPSYEALRSIHAERTSPIVFWVGSGLSCSAGLPTWSALLEELDTIARREAQLDEDRIRRLGRLDSIKKIQNPWTAFEELQKVMGETSFRETVKQMFASVPDRSAPSVYARLWNLRPSGFLTLNIDRLLVRARSQSSNTRSDLIETTGHRLKSQVHILREPRPFVAHLHGIVEDSASWVLTESQLKKLRRNPGYLAFVQACLATRTIVFMGISADDVAVGGFLEKLSGAGVDFGAHYWITDRRDADTRAWAESCGVRRIIYDAANGHDDPLNVMLNDLDGYVSVDEATPSTPVVLDVGADEASLDEHDLLRTGDSNLVRRALNRRASRILADENPSVSYLEFLRDYDQALHFAWYTSTDPGRNRLFDYTLEDEIAKGAFGRVYRAIDPSGGYVAVKVLLEDVRKNPRLLSVFRRGVRSMQILSEGGVDGMVPYLSSTEIPAMVVMKWVDGPNLQEGVEAGKLRELADKLKVADELARIVRRGHSLPQRVLHRDIRPSNIMLEDFYTGEWRVVVLDFDLSWHRDALEKSVLPQNAVVGYLAPEQIQNIVGASTRSSAVDSFGFGMTIYFLVGGRHPEPGAYARASWAEDVRGACRKLRSQEWISAPNRLARLLLFCTREAQAERWDFSQIESEIQRLNTAVRGGETPWPDMIAEEVMARAAEGELYDWNEDRVTATFCSPAGIIFMVAPSDQRECLRLEVQWASQGNEHRRGVGKWIIGSVEEVSACLRAGGWRIRTANKGRQDFQLIATHRLPGAEEIQQTSEVIAQVMQVFRKLG